MSIVERNLESVLRKAASQYPVVSVTGPRQSGKTTLVRSVFDGHRYVSLEAPDQADFAREDPRGFLGQFEAGVILDEVQNVPELLSYLQTIVDDDPDPGRFVLTGSQHFALSEAISQSLAGRTSVNHLLPMSYSELQGFDDAPQDLWEVVWSGGYPRILDQGIDPNDWLSNYVTTYVQRDVRQVLNVGDLTTFTTFLRLVAGRTAQERNLSTLGGDAGVSHNTARSWLSVLQTSFLTIELPAFYRSFRKRLVKSPKLHFLDSGLVCYLLGISEPDQLIHHPLRGAIFETWVVSEIYKARVHAGLEPAMSHLRQTRGVEIDCLIEAAHGLILAEMKSGETVHSKFLRPLTEIAEELEERDEWSAVHRRLIYGGTQRQRRTHGDVIPWNQINDVTW
jgi:hypothetical protein